MLSLSTQTLSREPEVPKCPRDTKIRDQSASVALSTAQEPAAENAADHLTARSHHHIRRDFSTDFCTSPIDLSEPSPYWSRPSGLFSTFKAVMRRIRGAGFHHFPPRARRQWCGTDTQQTLEILNRRVDESTNQRFRQVLFSRYVTYPAVR